MIRRPECGVWSGLDQCGLLTRQLCDVRVVYVRDLLKVFSWSLSSSLRPPFPGAHRHVRSARHCLLACTEERQIAWQPPANENPPIFRWRKRPTFFFLGARQHARTHTHTHTLCLFLLVLCGCFVGVKRHSHTQTRAYTQTDTDAHSTELFLRRKHSPYHILCADARYVHNS